MAPPVQTLVDDLGQIALLDSFVHQAVRHALCKLDLRAQIGRAYQRRHGEDAAAANERDGLADLERLHDELSALQPKIQCTFNIVETLRKRTKSNEPSESLRIRSRIFDLLRCCFPDVLTSPAKQTARRSAARGFCAAIRTPALTRHDPSLASTENYATWSLIRPAASPRVAIEMFLLLSAHISQVPANKLDMTDPCMVGERWYRLLADFLAQLAISAFWFGEHSQTQVLSAFDHVSPTTANREALYPSLWRDVNKDDIAIFDAAWGKLRLLVESLDHSQPELLRRSAPHKFWSCMHVYLNAVIDHLDPPTLDLYHTIHQTGRIPRGFFQTPEQADGSSNNNTGDSRAINSFIINSPFVATHPMAPMLAGTAGESVSQSPSVRAARALALNDLAMAASYAVSTGEDMSPRLAPLAACGGAYTPASAARPQLIADGYDSEISDVEMSPSQHAYVKRQKSSELAAAGAATPKRFVRQLGLVRQPSASMLDGENMDVEHTVVMSSPSVMLSAKHDRRVKESIRHKVVPPVLDFAAVAENSTSDNNTSALSPEVLPLDSSMTTTPKAQTGESSLIEKHRYVSDWTQGDIEGGGRPHRRRHDAGIQGTPAGTARDGTRLPPPQTILSPKNIALARHTRTSVDVLGAERGSNSTLVGPASDMPNSTPERGRVSLENLMPPQITPEHQIGPTADFRVRSASRYVVRKEEGDTEGGGRKHRKRHRTSGLELPHSGF